MAARLTYNERSVLRIQNKQASGRNYARRKKRKKRDDSEGGFEVARRTRRIAGSVSQWR